MKFIESNKLFQKKMATWFLLAIFFVILDRFFKIVSVQQFNYVLITDWLKFSLAKNYFIAFSIPLSGTLLNYTIFFIIIGLIFSLLTNKGQTTAIKGAFSFIILGASSNLFDRLKYGYVIDYLSVKWFTVFNIADAMIVCAIFYLLITEFRKK
ncbi:signal peptidase II [Candidatus Parcubacteria bacterium]|nr:signal peptidase II [Patescibacteria group bacterium]MBU4309706.1 signal peptidase II [Patescibacteria group bacterium]MBU4431670.1 signal peptidase II [Patescibacteria group bacterium]MBU4577906.1 signal peptidase II [Patescibacteria group bacterium]MCG2696584.1 signal peptidase II [Candidatus Parcubacteria bacterium]